jgi:hypothetical protein
MVSKLSIFTTITNPFERMDPYLEAIESYLDLADEVVIMNGDHSEHLPHFHRIFGKLDKSDKIKVVTRYWPDEFPWEFIGQQFQRGYDACTGDWVIRADLDYIFHERDMGKIRTFLEILSANDTPAASFWKYQFLLVDGYQIKSRPVIAINKRKFGNRIKLNGGGDLCAPTLDGYELTSDMVPEIRCPIYNYDFCFKTQGVVAQDFSRFTRAWNRHFGDWPFGGPTPEMALQGFKEMMLGRFTGRERQHIALEKHPKYIQDTIRNMTPEMFGHSLWGMVDQTADYFKEAK